MAINYGIGYCKTVIKNLEALEDDLFEKTGYGFDKFSHENMNLIEYRRLLSKFTEEKMRGLTPSYDPAIHGSHY
jgi:hypothetical protein